MLTYFFAVSDSQVLFGVCFQPTTICRLLAVHQWWAEGSFVASVLHTALDFHFISRML